MSLHQTPRISCPLDVYGDKLSPLGTFQPFPFNSVGGRPRVAGSFGVQKIGSHFPIVRIFMIFAL